MDIKQIKKQALDELAKIRTSADLEQYRIKYLGRRGEVSDILKSLKDLTMAKKEKSVPRRTR